jgi:hypothetical protein
MASDNPALKEMLDAARFAAIAGELTALQPDFERARFLKLGLAGLDTLSLVQRLRRMSAALHATLPPNYARRCSAAHRPPLCHAGIARLCGLLWPARVRVIDAGAGIFHSIRVFGIWRAAIPARRPGARAGHHGALVTLAQRCGAAPDQRRLPPAPALVAQASGNRGRSRPGRARMRAPPGSSSTRCAR